MVLDRFIVLEGLDGAGTTTQLRLAAEKLAAARAPSLLHLGAHRTTRWAC